MGNKITNREIEDRWRAIRNRKSSAIREKDIIDYLSRPESALTKEKIVATLKELADYRLQSANGWVNAVPPTPGELVICEGIETFFVPAVEGALSIQEFLDAYPDRANDFLKALQDDMDSLLRRWGSGFEGLPYLEGNPSEALNPEIHELGVNSVESAAMAIRVILHFYTLVLNLKGEEKRFPEFFNTFFTDRKTSFENIFKKALKLIVDAFQKNGADDLVSVKTGKKSGSGWSWCELQGLPPMLYFTQCTVDAFAELDLYLLRPYKEYKNLPQALLGLYTKNIDNIENFQICVDMSRRWVINTSLDDITYNFGFHHEETANVEILDSINNQQTLDEYIQDLHAIGNFQRNKKIPTSVVSPFVMRMDGDQDDVELNAPFAEYNSLYALTIILWSYGDQRDDGEDDDPKIKRKIERALLQLIINYKSYPVIKQIFFSFQTTRHAGSNQG